MYRLTFVLPFVVMGLTACKKNEGPVLEIPCSQNTKTMHYGPGMSFLANCPEGCDATGKNWGDGLYTGDSPICRSSIHAGVIDKGGGKVRVTIQPGQDSYKGSTKNGITTEKYGRYGSSYAVADP